MRKEIGICLCLLVHKGQNTIFHIFCRSGLSQIFKEAPNAVRVRVCHRFLRLGINLLQLLQFRLLLLSCKLRLDAVFQNRVSGGEVIGFLLKPLDVAEVDADLHKIALDAPPVNFITKPILGKFAAEFLQILFCDIVFQNQL